jgi:DNA-directed RNA polymerase subunit RPC12/RpoP
VILAEVLEHLPDELIRTLSKELARVSRRYLIVSVPYREAVSASYLRCRGCGLRYHVWGHQRSYTLAQLRRQLPHWRCLRHILMGPETSRPSELLGRMTRRWATFARSDEKSRALCPNCGSRTVHENDTWVAKKLYAAFWHSRSVIRKRFPIWLGAVFERK